MAEKLLDAIAKSGYKTVSEPVKQTAKAALDPQIMSTIYRTGIIGPLIKNIVSEYKKGDSKKEGVITSDLSKNIQTFSVKLDTIADIMEDIKLLTMQQLSEDKKSSLEQRKLTKKREIQSVEDKIERKPFISSLSDQTDKMLSKPSLGVFGELGKFIKDNPLLSSLVAGILVTFSGELQKFVSGIFKGANVDPGGAVGKLRDSIGNGLDTVFDNLGVSINESMSSVLSSAVLGGIASRLLGMKFKTGAFAGAGIGVAGQVMDKPLEGESSMLDNPILQAVLGIAAGLGIEVGAKKLGKRIFSPKTPSPVPKPEVKPPMSVMTEPKTTPSTRIKDYENKRLEERRAVRASERGSLKATVERIKRISKKVGFKRIALFLAKRFGVLLGASLAGGPLGLVIGIIGAGWLMYDINEALIDMEQADVEGYDRTAEDVAVGVSRPPIDNTPERMIREDANPMRPPMASYNLGDYEAKVIQAESEGRNIKNPLSSAMGVYQITRDTFEGLRRNYEELSAFTYDEFKKNTDIQKMFFKALTSENSKKLKDAGFAADEKNLYLAHRFGAPDAIRILKGFQQDPNTGLKDIIPSERWSKIKEQNPDITENTTVAGALLGAQSKMDKNIQMNATSLSNMAPSSDPRMNLGLIKELQEIESMLTNKPTTIIMDNSQNISSTSGGSNENRRGNPTPLMPYIVDHSKLREGLVGPH